MMLNTQLDFMIKWLNSNQGFAIALLTFVYVAATVIIALIMAKSNVLARKNLELALQLEKSRSRPYVIFDLIIDLNLVHAVVKNLGLTAAIDVRIDVDPTLIVTIDKEKKKSVLVTNSIGFLAPNREFKDFIDTANRFLLHYPDLKLKGNISYSDIQGVRYTEGIAIDLNFQKELTGIAEKDIGRELEKLTDKVEKISRTIDKWKIST